jgi:xanthine dehydrogenase molybdopterin-binding subunit B
MKDNINISGIPISKIHINETSTDLVANSSATAASMGSDIYGISDKNRY